MCHRFALFILIYNKKSVSKDSTQTQNRSWSYSVIRFYSGICWHAKGIHSNTGTSGDYSKGLLDDDMGEPITSDCHAYGLD